MVGEHGQVGHPGSDLIAILLGHHPRDLRDVAEVVHHPGWPAGGAASRGPRLGWLPGRSSSASPRRQERSSSRFAARSSANSASSDSSDAARVAAPVAEAVVRLEPRIGPAGEDDARPGNPVGLLAVDQVAHHVEGAEGLGRPRCPAPTASATPSSSTRSVAGVRRSRSMEDSSSNRIGFSLPECQNCTARRCTMN